MATFIFKDKRTETEIALTVDLPETIELLDFVFGLVDSYLDASADGNVNFLDYPKFLDDLMRLPNAFEGINKVGGELLSIADENIDDLIARYAVSIPGTQDQKRELIISTIEKGMVFARSIIDLVRLKKAAAA